MPETNPILAPQVVPISFGLEPVVNALESLSLLTHVEALSGLGEWVLHTSADLPDEVRRHNDLVMIAFDMLFYHESTLASQSVTFPDYIDLLSRQDATALRDTIINRVVELPGHHPDIPKPEGDLPTADDLLSDRDRYMAHMAMCWRELSELPELLVEAHRYLTDPPALKGMIVSHLRHMWTQYLADEWERVLPMLEESVAAFETIDYSGLTPLEAIRAVTGRDVRGIWDEKLAQSQHLTFVPSAHIGPYLGGFKLGSTMRIVFGARLPRGAQAMSSALSRSELLVRLNALTDETRLRILELLTKHEELCAQDIIERLDVSQSSVSRHLSQLSATGYITERRREVAKCYSLNTDRVVDTLRALTNFLSRQ